MCRSSLAILGLLCFASISQASRTAAADRLELHETVVLASSAPNNPSEQQARTEKNSGELIITDKTEIRLDGTAIRLDAVPTSAEVHLLEVAADQRTILKLHFRRK